MQALKLRRVSHEWSLAARRAFFSAVFRSYCASRLLSRQQRRVLALYLKGKGAEEIARLCNCRVATVHEHWRRMARKAGVTLKSQVVADFHRFLGAA